jgi:hypothetical protein
MFAQKNPASIILCALSTLVLMAVPYRAELNGPLPTLSVHEAFAKEGGSGKGTSSKGGGDPDTGASSGNHKGSGGKAGSPQSSGKAGSPGGSRRGGPGNKSGGTSSGTKSQQINRPTGDRNGLSGRSIAIFHSNGMREEIRGGRYEMRDAGGRTIVNRPATPSDLSRLLQFQR